MSSSEEQVEGFLKKIPKLQDEIDSWAPFVESLRLEDRALFKSMIQKTWSYSDSIDICRDEHVTEALLLSILISQQKTINWLASQLERLNRSTA